MRARVRRLAQLLRQHPAGLVSVRYLGPRRLTAAQRTHRSLLWQSHPARSRSAAATLNAVRWVWWVFVGARRATRRWLQVCGDDVAAEAGISLRTQRRALLRLALAHSIHPRDYYLLCLYEPGRRRIFWDYVFDFEAGVFHWLRSNEPPASSSDRLADKHSFAELLEGAGLPAVPVMALLPAGSASPDLPATTGELIVKPQRGSGSRGVLRVQRTAHGVVAKRLDGREIDGDHAKVIDERLAATAHVVQPYFETPAHLRHIGAGERELTTLRVITARRRANDGLTRPTVYCGYLEVPWTHGYVAIRIDPSTARLHRLLGAVPKRVEEAFDEHLGMALPFWNAAVEIVEQCHLLFAEHWAVAWDLVPTHEGFLVLEGNRGWSTLMPQLSEGPLLGASRR